MSFLSNYLTYTSGNEAPKLFHIWSGLSVLSSLVSRKVWLQQGIFTWYPNLYVVLVGEPGNGKSTALDIAKAAIRAQRDVPLAADAMTVQALLRYMSEEGSPCKKSFSHPETKAIVQYHPITIFAGELVSFLSMDPHGWIVFLTTVYHEEVHEVKTKNKGDDLLNGPYVTLLGCLTPDIANNMQQQRIISTGFARRTIFVWGARSTEAVPFPEITPEMVAARDAFMAYAQELKKVKGEFKWDPVAREWYGPWYKWLRANIGKMSTPATAGYYESKHVQLLKTAMLISLSESTELILKLEHLQVALKFLEDTEVNLSRVFEGSGRNEDAGAALAIYEYLEKANDGVPLKRLLSTFFSQVKEGRAGIDRILHHLKLSDRVVQWTAQLPGGYIADMVATVNGKKNFDAKLKNLQPGSSPDDGKVPDFSIELSPPKTPSVPDVPKPPQASPTNEPHDPATAS